MTPIHSVYCPEGVMCTHAGGRAATAQVPRRKWQDVPESSQIPSSASAMP